MWLCLHWGDSRSGFCTVWIAAAGLTAALVVSCRPPSLSVWGASCFFVLSWCLNRKKPLQPGNRSVSEPFIFHLRMETWRMTSDWFVSCYSCAGKGIWSGSLDRVGWVGGGGFLKLTILYLSKQSQYQDWKRKFYILWSFFWIILQSHLKYRAGVDCGWDGGETMESGGRMILGVGVVLGGLISQKKVTSTKKVSFFSPYK